MRVRCSRFGTLLAALLAVACSATRPAHAVPMLFTGPLKIAGETSSHTIPAAPNAMFLAAENSPLENLASACQVTGAYAGDISQQPDSSMMDTVKHPTVTVFADTPAFAGAIPLFSSGTQAQAGYISPWNENFRPSFTLSGTLAPGLGSAALDAGQLDEQVDSPDNSLIPGPGSIFLALGVVAAFAAFRLHEGLRG